MLLQKAPIMERIKRRYHVDWQFVGQGRCGGTDRAQPGHRDIWGD